MTKTKGAMCANHIQTVIVGSGVIGLAIARKFARQGHDVLVLEAEASGHHHTSARNSQVIHAGILCPPRSLKAKLCVAGREQLYDFCKTRHVDHARCEKLIIATDADQLKGLMQLFARATGVDDLQAISASEATSLEPNLRCHGAVLSPSTGIVDASAFMRALEAEAQADGALFAYHSPLLSVRVAAGRFKLQIADVDQTRMTCTNLVNAGGLGAWDVARGIKGYDKEGIPPQTFVKAGYYSLSSVKSPFERLIYPTPGSTGVHALRDTSGHTRFGPTTDFLNPPRINYQNNTSANILEPTIRKFWPDLPDGALQPDTCGIRPRITPQGAPLADFMIVGPRDHAVQGLVQLFGIESPGLTSSLAIADHVWAIL
tara:strand:- start:659 stop:1777 length:1119 start_codon:yes stop_codon:yes gene_type:complete